MRVALPVAAARQVARKYSGRCRAVQRNTGARNDAREGSVAMRAYAANIEKSACCGA